MKRKIIIASTLLIYGTSISQIVPAAGGQGTNSIEYWSRSGNNPNGSNNNIFGTIWNSPIYTITGGITPANVRMKLNGDFIGMGQYPINSYGSPQGVNTSGYMGLGYNIPIPGNQFLWSNKGPFSQLHLNGRDQTHLQEEGYRPWMKTGITLTDNVDLSYIGLRQVGTGYDITETVIVWSDNEGTSSPGPDDMVFRFTSLGTTPPSINSGNLQDATDLDGRHIARFTGSGEFGLGNTFGTNPTGTPANLYVRPASLGHYSLSNFRSVWQQFTNRDVVNGTGTGETASDGLRIGIIGNSNTNVNGTAAIYNQETRALLFSTNANTNSVNVTNGTTLERMRIMSVGTPTHLSSGGFGVYNPGSIATNISRIAMSHNPSQPVTRPLSLLHLGYNTGLNSNPAGSTDGWRSWMDIGTFTSNGTDNMYVGLKNEGTDRFDAVVSWGDNQSAGISNEGPDNLRFIFTSTTSSVINPGDPVSQSANGLEVARMEPTEDENGLPNSYGKLGVGDFYTTPLPVTHKLHVRGNGRFEYIPDMDSAGYLMIGQKVNSNNNNDLEFSKLGFTGNNTQVLLGDGTWGTASGGGGGAGNYCGTTQNPLTGDYEVPLADYSYNFTAGTDGRVNMGNAPCGMNMMSRLYVAQTEAMTAATSHSAIAGYTDGANLPNGMASQNSFGIAGMITRSRNHIHAGVYGISTSALNSTWSPNSTTGIGVWGTAANNMINMGVRGRLTDVNAAVNYAIIGEASGAIENWAFWGSGDYYSSGAWNPSDENLKENIEELKDANSILTQLNPKRYRFKTEEFSQLNLQNTPQIGFLAQELQKVLPEAVKDAVSPEVYDSLGNLTGASVSFKAVSYEKLIPVLVGGHNEQQSEIETLKQSNEQLKRDNEELRNQVNQLNEKMDVLIRCLQDKIPDLCRIEQGIIQQNQGNEEQIRNSINVELQNGTAIVLNQNVPNPFAESTVITFSIPESVANAQIIFHDATGSLIKSVDVRERGNRQINVYANDLSAGAYTYSLIADGKIVATKRMVKQ